MPEEAIYSASWLLTPNAPPLAGGALLVRNGIIIETGTLSTLRRKYSALLFDFPGCAIIPGFVNAHTHLELTHFPSWLNKSSVNYAPRRFTDWIIQLIKVLRGLTSDDYCSSIEEGVRICLDSGTTAVGEIVTNPAMAQHYYRSKISGRLYFELLGQDSLFFNSKLAAATTAAIHEEENALITSGLSPHSPYTIAEEHLPAIRNRSKLHSLPLAIHLSESRSEGDLLFDGSGELATDFYPFVGWERFLGHPPRCSSTELLHRNGLLTPSTLAIHCVHISNADATIIKSAGSHIVLCPRSNNLLDVGKAPVHLLKKLSIPMALGTDSLASNNSLSLWDELRFALDTFPNDLTANDVFKMVTICGAEALGISASNGTLEVGKRADFQVVENCNCNCAEEKILERVMRNGVVQKVFVRGVLSTPTTKNGHCNTKTE